MTSQRPTARLWTKSSADEREASTYGWDTVFAVRVSDANAQIRRAKSSPSNFECSPEAGTTVRGTFGDWQIGLGGDDKLIHLYLPLHTAQVDNTHGVHALAGVTAEVELQLQFVPKANPLLSTGGAVTHHLRVNAQKRTLDEPVATVSALHVDRGRPELGFLDEVLLRTGLELWLNQNLATFQHVFSVVEVGEHATGAFSWLRPTSVSYAYVDGTSSEDSYLGVLCMTEGRSSDKLLQQLSVNAIPSGARAGFLISRTMFLENILLPNLPSVFPGTRVEDFALMEDLRGIEARGQLPMAPVPHDGKTYTPTLEQLTVRISEQEIHFSAQTRVEVSPGIFSHCEHQSFLTLGLEERSSGATFVFKQVREPSQHDWTTHADGFDIADKILEVVVVLVGVLAIVLTGGAAAVATILIAGLLFGLVQITPKIIAAVGTDDAPAIDLLVLNATRSIRWTDGADFVPHSAFLNGSLQLGGNPTPAT